MKSISDMNLAEVTLTILKAAVNIPDGLYARAQFLAKQELNPEPKYVLAKQTAVEIPGYDRKELGYTLLEGIGVFETADDVHKAITELGLPLGWVSLTVDQLLPGGVK